MVIRICYEKKSRDINLYALWHIKAKCKSGGNTCGCDAPDAPILGVCAVNIFISGIVGDTARTVKSCHCPNAISCTLRSTA